MSGNRNKRHAKKKQKQKLRRAGKSRAGNNPSAATQGKLPSTRDAASWPVRQCFLSENWHEQGARVQAVFSRAAAGGPAMVAWCELDLATSEVTMARTATYRDPEHVQGMCVEVSEHSGFSMVEAPASRVAEGMRACEPVPECRADYEQILSLLAEQPSEPEEHPLRRGMPPVAPKKKPSLLARLFGS